jgi:uncharacterized protein DUF6152
MRTAAATLVGLAALACVGSLRAHHSGYMYQTTPIWIRGTVTRFEPKRPHTILTLEDKSDGQIRTWAVEGPPQTAVDRRTGSGEDVPKVGDTIEVCAFPYRPAEEIARDGRISGGDGAARRSPPTTDGSSRRFVAGYVLASPDGEMRLWEPHGFVSECIRASNDRRQPWLDFLNANPRAHELWCSERRRYAAIQSNASFHELVEELNGLLDDPCE